MYHSKKTKPERKLTQRELLEEAKQTERENLASLEAYSRLEAEKRKTEKKKVVYSGPVIRFHSCTMPLVTEINKGSHISPIHNVTQLTTSGTSSQSTSSDRDLAPPSVDSKEHKVAMATVDPVVNETGGDGSSTEESATSNKDTANQRDVYCRNFLIFTDTNNFPSAYFPTDKPRYPKKRFCPFTGLPAKYVDPLTGEIGIG